MLADFTDSKSSEMLNYFLGRLFSLCYQRWLGQVNSHQSVMADEELIPLCHGTGMYKLPDTTD